MLSKLTFGEHATEHARKFMREGAHPSVHDIAFVDAATVVTAGMDGKCRVWDARTGREWEFTHVAGMWDADGTPIMSVTVAPRRGIVAQIAVADRDGMAYSWDMDTPKSVLVKMLLLRTRPSPSPADGFARAAGHTGLRMEPRVAIADEAFDWADSDRANCIFFRLVDSGHVDIASYALKFLT